MFLTLHIREQLAKSTRDAYLTGEFNVMIPVKQTIQETDWQSLFRTLRIRAHTHDYEKIIFKIRSKEGSLSDQELLPSF